MSCDIGKAAEGSLQLVRGLIPGEVKYFINKFLNLGIGGVEMYNF